ncbi:OmpA family protein [Puniceibacterium sp. IMCC21224]|uniref:OmpA family protein n=1 Tax=Puniceibacterium sp. IMCC21224 TaxID=1618204 RepID=UPI00065D68B1|nr:OmpA family protein [Puniceibacterium sp. IMCC21224]KMK68748.1 OmpA family [Puniceibacterium sp. IMCC21224]
MNRFTTILMSAAVAAGMAAPAMAQEVNRECGLIVFFNLNQFQLSAETQAQIAALGQKYPDATYNLVGYTDSLGSSEYNLALSQRRAQSVADALSGLTIASATGAGESTRPGTTGPADAANRRVEVVRDACASLYSVPPLAGGGLAAAAAVGALGLAAALGGDGSGGGTTTTGTSTGN